MKRYDDLSSAFFEAKKAFFERAVEEIVEMASAMGYTDWMRLEDKHFVSIAFWEGADGEYHINAFTVDPKSKVPLCNCEIVACAELAVRLHSIVRREYNRYVKKRKGNIEAF